MKKVQIPCNVNGQVVDTDFFIGDPASGQHPIEFQAKWLNESNGGSVPPAIMKALEKLLAISKKSLVPFDELCEYAFKVANESGENAEDFLDNQTKEEEKDENKKDDKDKEKA